MTEQRPASGTARAPSGVPTESSSKDAVLSEAPQLPMEIVNKIVLKKEFTIYSSSRIWTY